MVFDLHQAPPSLPSLFSYKPLRLCCRHSALGQHEASPWDAGKVLSASAREAASELRAAEAPIEHQRGLRRTAETPGRLPASRELQTKAKQSPTSPAKPFMKNLPRGLLNNSPFVLPSSVSGEIEATEADESASARRLYSEKLQEVEEANEMLRRTNLLVDKENAFLQQVIA